mmetsp:Transcript_7997/g.25555  ORF Transcript_7997/g.25555 Transcript_7997/m.25555 type:complete len:226 (-) Transcript_7997:217-894(-)
MTATAASTSTHSSSQHIFVLLFFWYVSAFRISARPVSTLPPVSVMFPSIVSMSGCCSFTSEARSVKISFTSSTAASTSRTPASRSAAKSRCSVAASSVMVMRRISRSSSAACSCCARSSASPKCTGIPEKDDASPEKGVFDELVALFAPSDAERIDWGLDALTGCLASTRALPLTAREKSCVARCRVLVHFSSCIALSVPSPFRPPLLDALEADRSELVTIEIAR